MANTYVVANFLQHPELIACQVVFGELKEGKSIIRKIENLPTQSDKPTKDVTIVGMSNHAIMLGIAPN